MKNKLHRTSLVWRLVSALLAAGLMTLTSTLGAQQSLQQVAEEAGTDWIIGHWTGETAEGQRVSCEFEWQLGGHAVRIAFKMESHLHSGMIYLAADRDEVVEVGADNQGGSVEGVWIVEGENLVSKTKRVFPDGRTMRAVNTHSRIDDATMKVAFHIVEETGDVGQEPAATLVFKRKAETKGDGGTPVSP